MSYPNQGADRRLLGRIGAAIQNALSVKEGGPRFKHWRWAGLFQLVLAYPPYIAAAFRLAPTWRWLQFRAGVRYDKNWAGYIFPEGEVKKLKAGEDFVAF